jgi:hypothetical protein
MAGRSGIDSYPAARHQCDPMNCFAANFYFSFAGYFTPQNSGGMSPRKL